MKGIAHFAAGVAAASCFPGAVDAAAHGSSMLLLVGGLFGLLPDTLDFKLARYLSRHDVEIAPDPLDPDPALVCNALVEAIAHAKGAGRSVCVKLHTIRLSAEIWQSYVIRVDRREGCVSVRLGDKVNSGGERIDVPLEAPACKLRLPCDLVMDYGSRVEVGFLEGPTLLLEPHGDYVRSSFIHWHREWSHSIVVALGAGLVVALSLGVLAGGIAFLAMSLHALMDQAGFMGGNLFFPFSRERKSGAKITTSGNPVWNFAAVWLSVVIVFWNLGGDARCADGFVHYMIWVGFVPIGVFRFLVH